MFLICNSFLIYLNGSLFSSHQMAFCEQEIFLSNYKLDTLKVPGALLYIEIAFRVQVLIEPDWLAVTILEFAS